MRVLKFYFKIYILLKLKIENIFICDKLIGILEIAKFLLKFLFQPKNCLKGF